MGLLCQLRLTFRRLESSALERELLAACGRPTLLTRHERSLNAAEGLLLATILSTVLWSLILFTVSHLR